MSPNMIYYSGFYQLVLLVKYGRLICTAALLTGAGKSEWPEGRQSLKTAAIFYTQISQERLKRGAVDFELL